MVKDQASNSSDAAPAKKTDKPTEKQGDKPAQKQQSQRGHAREVVIYNNDDDILLLSQQVEIQVYNAMRMAYGAQNLTSVRSSYTLRGVEYPVLGFKSPLCDDSLLFQQNHQNPTVVINYRGTNYATVLLCGNTGADAFYKPADWWPRVPRHFRAYAVQPGVPAVYMEHCFTHAMLRGAMRNWGQWKMQPGETLPNLVRHTVTGVAPEFASSMIPILGRQQQQGGIDQATLTQFAALAAAMMNARASHSASTTPGLSPLGPGGAAPALQLGAQVTTVAGPPLEGAVVAQGVTAAPAAATHSVPAPPGSGGVMPAPFVPQGVMASYSAGASAPPRYPAPAEGAPGFPSTQTEFAALQARAAQGMLAPHEQSQLMAYLAQATMPQAVKVTAVDGRSDSSVSPAVDTRFPAGPTVPIPAPPGSLPPAGGFADAEAMMAAAAAIAASRNPQTP